MRNYKRLALILLMLTIPFKVTQASPDAPDLTGFLTGRLVADGKFSDFAAGSTRGMHVKIFGVRRGDNLDLTEDMAYSDGEKRKFVWRFTRENGKYVGHRPDLIGAASVIQKRDVVEIAYRANIVLPSGAKQVLDFVETLTLKGDDSATLQISISKFFLPVARAELTITKLAEAE